ncbi:MAG: serine hydrolase domain-containing protein [Candidatus Hodarchaeales archaeon]
MHLKTKNKQKLHVLLFFISIFLMTGISSPSLGTQTPDYWPTEGWQVSTPATQNMSKSKLENMVNYIKDQNYAIDSVLIVKNGYIVFEEYLNPDYNENTSHSVHSITKSVLSFATGAAIERGYIEGLDQNILDFFPEQEYQNPDPRKENITIRHLLTMTSGLEWDESLSFDNPNNTLTQLLNSLNGVQFILDQPIAVDPGTSWNYNTGEFHLLSAILRKATSLNNVSLDEFLGSLGDPIGLGDVPWETDRQGIPLGGTGLFFSSRDLAKLGFLYINNGTWENQQIIPADWISITTTTCISANEVSDYCYGWWRDKKLDVYYASGYAGQLVIPISNHDMVVVFTASDETNWPYMELLEQYIFPALEADTDTISGFIVLL